MYLNRIHPSIISPARHLGKYVCIRRNHASHLGTVIQPRLLRAAATRSCFLYSPNGSWALRAAFLSPIRFCSWGLDKSAFMFAFTQLMACSTIFKNGVHFDIRVLVWGLRSAMRWSGAPSKIRLCIPCASKCCLMFMRKLLEDSSFMPPIWMIWWTKPNTGDIAKHQVMFRPLCPHTWRYALSPLSERPWFLAVRMLNPHSSMKIVWLRLASLRNHWAYAWRRWITSGLLRSADSWRDNFKVYNIYHLNA